MTLKDYYEILELPADASAGDIKKAYRKLAMRYHPDRNHASPFARHHFQEVSEAYTVLSNPVTRSEYHEKRKRLHPDEKHPRFVLVAGDLVRQAAELDREWHEMDLFRMDQEALRHRLLQLLNDRHLQIMNEGATATEKEQFFKSTIHTAALLPYPLLAEVLPKLTLLSAGYPSETALLAGFERKQKKEYLWNKYQGFLVLFLALAISLLIYLTA